MASIAHTPPRPQPPLNGDYAELELAFYGRRTDAERLLLEWIYGGTVTPGPLTPGDVREAVRLARGEGIGDASWLGDEHLLLWRIACEAKTTAEACEAVRQARRDGLIFVIHLPALLGVKMWFPARLLLAARALAELVAAEREARLCAARYRALLAGTVKPTPTTRMNARAA